MSEDRAAEVRIEQEQDQDQAHQMALAIAKSRMSAPPPQPPVNTDVPHVYPEVEPADVGSVLVCTMGNWEGDPTSYSYQWKSGDADTGDGSANYTVVDTDAGKDITCVVTASNAVGHTAAPASAPVSIPAAKATTKGSLKS